MKGKFSQRWSTIPLIPTNEQWWSLVVYIKVPNCINDMHFLVHGRLSDITVLFVHICNVFRYFWVH